MFDNQVLRIDGSPGPVISSGWWTTAEGLLDRATTTRWSGSVRLLTREFDVRVNAGFFRERIQEAWDAGNAPVSTKPACGLWRGRWPSGTGGRPVPGRRNDPGVLVLQTLSLGMDRWKDVLVDALREVTGASRVFERNDVPIRTKEGLDPQKGFLSEPFETRIRIRENDLIWEVDGHPEDRSFPGPTTEPRVHCTDACLAHVCWTVSPTPAGSHCMRHAMAPPRSPDWTSVLMRCTRQNERRLERTWRPVHVQEANVDHLTEASRRVGNGMDRAGPPAFAKSRSALDKAWRGYRRSTCGP